MTAYLQGATLSRWLDEEARWRSQATVPSLRRAQSQEQLLTLSAVWLLGLLGSSILYMEAQRYLYYLSRKAPLSNTTHF